MVGTEVTLQIVATLSGAALVSFLLIAFINAEAKSRISHQEPEIENMSLWKVIANKMSHLTSASKAVNTTEKASETSTASRKLQWADEGTHHVRHGKHKGTRRGTPVIQVQQESCYSGNEVLIIIGVTCLLNFAFVLLVMACVHYCSSKNDRIPRCDQKVEDESKRLI
ncbi:uncharacterized protein LOC106670026 isoform X2 [Cimex lectularius]|uniref:Transmembrane protein n=1 Tax=Cimex lectularius TaxID=79782 RepID=A0A8I6S3I3_CIMLE|nr:uncharacterized protein LOC106670026 isoform X2 [Cimex lectularius]